MNSSLIPLTTPQHWVPTLAAVGDRADMRFLEFFRNLQLHGSRREPGEIDADDLRRAAFRQKVLAHGPPIRAKHRRAAVRARERREDDEAPGEPA